MYTRKKGMCEEEKVYVNVQEKASGLGNQFFSLEYAR
jgi:hypothetical protein